MAPSSTPHATEKIKNSKDDRLEITEKAHKWALGDQSPWQGHQEGTRGPEEANQWQAPCLSHGEASSPENSNLTIHSKGGKKKVLSL